MLAFIYGQSKCGISAETKQKHTQTEISVHVIKQKIPGRAEILKRNCIGSIQLYRLLDG